MDDHKTRDQITRHADAAVRGDRYSGDSGDVTIRSPWQDEGGRAVIVHAEPTA